MTIAHSFSRTLVGIVLVGAALFSSGGVASAAYRHHHYRSYHHTGRAVSYSGSLDASCRSAARMGGPCGCWAAEHFFGNPVRALWLAANWLRFPRTQAAAGTAAVWPNAHHVAPVVAVNGDGTVTVADSWATHAVRMAGLRFVNPHGGSGVGDDVRYASRHRVLYARYERKPSRQEAYFQRNHYAGADVYRPDYH